MRMINKSRLISILSLLLVFLFSCTEKKKETKIKSIKDSTQEITSASVYNLDIDFLNQRGEKIKWSSFQGKPVILSMIFTNCSSACPMIVENIIGIKQKLRDPKNQLKHILVSFDPEHDSPEQLMKFCKEKSLGKDWVLLTGNESDIRMLAMTLDIKFKKTSSGGFDHSNTIILLNPQGDIASRSDVLNEDHEDMIVIANSFLNQQIDAAKQD